MACGSLEQGKDQAEIAGRVMTCRRNSSCGGQVMLSPEDNTCRLNIRRKKDRRKTETHVAALAAEAFPNSLLNRRRVTDALNPTFYRYRVQRFGKKIAQMWVFIWLQIDLLVAAAKTGKIIFISNNVNVNNTMQEDLFICGRPYAIFVIIYQIPSTDRVNLGQTLMKFPNMLNLVSSRSNRFNRPGQPGSNTYEISKHFRHGPTNSTDRVNPGQTLMKFPNMLNLVSSRSNRFNRPGQPGSNTYEISKHVEFCFSFF
ncbi:hypothetical protein LXL04_003865 [Taraxacum kok-saghyz]